MTSTQTQNLQAAFNLSQDIRDIEHETRNVITAFHGRGGTVEMVRTGFKASLGGFAAVSTSSNLQAINNWLYQVEAKAKAANLKRGD
jgi:hypothetical protein